jgi:hypothetical protein
VRETHPRGFLLQYGGAFHAPYAILVVTVERIWPGRGAAILGDFRPKPALPLFLLIPMRSLIGAPVERLPSRGWCWVAVLASCLGLSGCTSLDSLRGEKFPEDENTRICEGLRPREHNDDSLFFFSNKAHQIDKHLGAE